MGFKLFNKKKNIKHLTLFDWVHNKEDSDLVNLYIACKVIEDYDALSLVVSEIYQRENWLKISTEVQDILFEGGIIDKNQFVFLRIIDELSLKAEETQEEIIEYLDSVGNLEVSVRMMIAKYYNPKTMGEPFTNEEIQKIINGVRAVASES